MTVTKRYPLKTSVRTGCATLTELADRIRVSIEFARYGDLGDEVEVRAALAPIFDQYATDPRPFEMANQHSGETVLVTGVGAVGIAMVVPPPRH